MLALLLVLSSVSFAQDNVDEKYCRQAHKADKRCADLAKVAKVADNFSPEQKYCSVLRVRANEADRISTSPPLIESNWTLLNQLQAAIFRDIEADALTRNLSFEEYAQMVARKSKFMGKEIKLDNNDFARARYVNAFYNKVCSTEASAPGGGGQRLVDAAGDIRPYVKTITPAKLPVFAPFTIETSSAAK